MKVETEITRMLGMQVPIIGAPMFLVSRVELVAAVTNAGGLGAFPSLNYRTHEEFRQALSEIKAKVGNKPFGVNLIVKGMGPLENPRLFQDMDACIEEKVALIITSLGNPAQVVEKARKVGTRVFCDVINLKHAMKVKDAGADALIAVTAGAGGHAGAISPLVLVPYLREKTGLPVVAAGGIATGAQIAAALALGAGAAYVGTRFIATPESDAPQEFKEMIIACGPDDIIYSNKVSGVWGNFLKPSYDANFGKGNAWKDVWSAGQNVGLIDDISPAGEVVSRMMREYAAAVKQVPLPT
ncbi:MAG: nitronate monooxygenase [Deltaproteobacteria bacterium]|nr:nitronate monooxygenase [Deltaproteobacteria bacterium]